MSINYSIVKSEDISSAMKASSISTSSGNKMKRQDGLVWDQTVCIIMERVTLAEVSRDTSKDGIKKIGITLKGLMSNYIFAETIIPETGKNREGATFDVSDKDGVPKWSSWDQTRRIWAYLGDIAKIIAYGKEDDLYPEALKVGARCDVLKGCKVAETPILAIDHLSAELQKNLDVMKDKAEVLHAHHAVSGLMVNNLDAVTEAQDLIMKLDALMSHMDEDELSSVQGSMGVFIPYFNKKAA